MVQKSNIIHIGEGTSFTWGYLNPKESKGVITKYDDSPGIADTAGLWTWASDKAAFPTSFPGAGMPLQTMKVKMLDGGRVIATAHYDEKSGYASSFKTSPAKRSAITHESVIEFDEDTGRPKPEKDQPPPLGPKEGRAIVIGQLSLTYKTEYFTESSPSLMTGKIGKINKDEFFIWGYEFMAGTLRFEGLTLEGQEYPGRDFWEYSYEFTYDSDMWLTGTVVKVLDDEGAWTGEYAAKKIPIYGPSYYVEFGADFFGLINDPSEPEGGGEGEE